MSSSAVSLNFCFCRLDIMLKAMFSMSSAEMRGWSVSDTKSPSMRICGKLPTFRCRSDALRSIAIRSKSSIFIGYVLMTQTDGGSPLLQQGEAGLQSSGENDDFRKGL